MAQPRTHAAAEADGRQGRSPSPGRRRDNRPVPVKVVPATFRPHLLLEEGAGTRRQPENPAWSAS